MGKQYRVVGGLEVCNTPAGEVVSEEDLLAYPANIEALVAGGHLEEVDEAAADDEAEQEDPEPAESEADAAPPAKPARRPRAKKDGDG